jgi:hypothetical protein
MMRVRRRERESTLLTLTFDDHDNKTPIVSLCSIVDIITSYGRSHAVHSGKMIIRRLILSPLLHGLSWANAFSILTRNVAGRSNQHRAAPSANSHHRRQSSATSLHLLPPDSSASLFSAVDPHVLGAIPRASSIHLSSILLSFDVFDGSTIVDPVVVSSSFWSGLQRQIISLLIGQLLAGAVFTLVVTFFASQLSNLRDFVISTFLSSGGNNGGVGNGSNNPNKTFIRADAVTTRVDPDFGKLLICLLIDIVGSSSEMIPILGEFTDIISAPIAATVLQSVYGSKILFFFEFAEEILPFTDIIPFATLCWVIDTYLPESDVAAVLQIGKFNNENRDRLANEGNDIIDTSARSLDPTSSSSTTRRENIL